MRFLALLAAGSSMGLAACEAQAPTTPTWADDVQPLLLASCASCHGPTRERISNKVGMAFRFDLCDADGFKDTGVDVSTIFGAGPFKTMIVKTVTGDEPRMPPPPAGRLTPYERDVLTRWKQACERPDNHAPDARLVSAREQGDDPVVVVDVVDPDRDTVLGKLSVGTFEKELLYTGRHEIHVPRDQASASIRAKISDGWGPPIDVVLR
jgi:hypothetical protein